jgi:predicted ribosomally synthesized peptide with SipW-like signal peptide
MKKILISLAIIGVAAGITLGITGAYFTDSQPIEDNVFQAGTLDIQQGPNDLGNMTLSDLMPGVATAPKKLQMGNNGTLHAVIDKIEVTSLTDGDTDGDDANDVSAVDYAAKVNTTISDEIGRPLWKGTLADLNSVNAVDGTDRVFLAKKGSGANYNTTRDYWFTFELDSDADDDYQGEGVNATFSVNATQVKDSKFDAGERLLATQNNDGSWEWSDPDTDPTGGSSPNLVGVTAAGLLRAYEFSGNSDYFDAA